MYPVDHGLRDPGAAVNIRPVKSPRGRVLLFSYAFPPMQVQMMPAVFKPMAAIAQQGYTVDVLCADSFCKEQIGRASCRERVCVPV